MTKDILFSPISRAPSIWIAFAKTAAVPVLLNLNIYFLFVWWKSYENNVVFEAKQSIHSGTEKTNTVCLKKEGKVTEKTCTTKKNTH